ncbi:hypothetical protein HKX48_008559 [Thoreauomyces humboldtii]|nr:hypothetical protein HKX48_008559 [Thoreauomyces humboldtii]
MVDLNSEPPNQDLSDGSQFEDYQPEPEEDVAARPKPKRKRAAAAKTDPKPKKQKIEANGVATSRAKKIKPTWDDALLRRCMLQHGKWWKPVAEAYNLKTGRTAEQIHGRWRSIEGRDGTNDTEEDRELRQLVQELGTKWAEVAKAWADSHGVSAEQIRGRWRTLEKRG